MSSPTPSLPWWKRLENSLDAWAAKRLSPEEYAEALVLDKQLKRNFWRWLARYAVVVGFFGLLVWSLWPQLGLAKSMGMSAAGCTYILLAIFSAWYGYRKYTKRPAWMVFLIFIVLVLGGAVV